MSNGEHQILLTLIGKLERIETKMDGLTTDLARYGAGLTELTDAMKMQTERISALSQRVRDREGLGHGLRG
jgi:hypothetical protein